MSGDGNEVKSFDRLDALLSARMDNDLTSDERTELAALIAGDPDHAARVSQFENVDAQLRSLADESIDEDSLATAYAGLRARLGTGLVHETGSDQSLGRPANRGDLRTNSLGGPRIPLLLAVAAALILYLAIPTTPPSTSSSPTRPSAVDKPEDLALAHPNAGSKFAPGVEDELILVLGYGEEMSELQGITSDDLDVIEQLELLDFLSDREQAVGVLGVMGERG